MILMWLLTQRVLLLTDGRILKERKGLHLVKEKPMCPFCGGKVQPADANSLGFLFSAEAKDESSNGSLPQEKLGSALHVKEEP